MDDKKSQSSAEPLISIIIPCYNSEKTIETTLQSLEKQSYSNFEVIIVNDGSKDSTDKIIRSYMSNSRLKFKYKKQENLGVSNARNTGLEYANGKYVVFLDSDDIYHCSFVTILTETLEKLDVDTVFCTYSREIVMLSIQKNIKNYNVESFNSKQLMECLMYKSVPMGFFTFIYKKSIIDIYNIRFTPKAKYGEDLEFLWKYVSHCKNGAAVNKALYGYYDNPASVVNTVDWGKLDLLDSVTRIEAYLKDINSDFYMTYRSYMYARTMWAVLKTFACAKRKDLFYRLTKELDTKSHMKKLLNTQNLLIRITSVVFVISPQLFYWLILQYGRIGRGLHKIARVEGKKTKVYEKN